MNIRFWTIMIPKNDDHMSLNPNKNPFKTTMITAEIGMATTGVSNVNHIGAMILKFVRITPAKIPEIKIVMAVVHWNSTFGEWAK